MQHSHLIFVGDTTWPSTDRNLEHLEALREEGVDIAVDAFPYVGGNTTLIVFLPPWALADMQTALDPAGGRERLARAIERTFELVGMRWEDTQILWVPRREHADYEGRTVAEIAKDRGRSGTETYLELVGELGGSTRIINWNYSGRDDEETSLRKVLAHPLTCFETDTILTGHGVDNPASFGTFPRVLGRYVRELGMIELPEAVRRMTSFSAERMGLRDRGRIARGLARRSGRVRPGNHRRPRHAPRSERRLGGHPPGGDERPGRRRRRPLRPHLTSRHHPTPSLGWGGGGRSLRTCEVQQLRKERPRCSWVQSQSTLRSISTS